MQALRTLLVLAALCLTPLLAGSQDEPEQPVTVVLVRHAETAGSTRTGGSDPQLSPEGEARAAALAHLLAASGATHVFTSELTRTRATAAPLAEQLGLKVETVPARDGEQQLELLRALEPGSVALVVGHSNTVPALVEGLGGSGSFVAHEKYGPMLAHEEYDRLFVVTLPGVAGATASTLELRYGD